MAKTVNTRNLMDIVCLTNAITDVLIKVTDEELEQIKLIKGYGNRKSQIDYPQFLRLIGGKEALYIPGGSPFNTARSASTLGLKTAVIGTVGDDNRGRAYIDEVRSNKIKSLIHTAQGYSGLCFLLVTPDGEKTTVATMGVTYKYTLGQNPVPAKIFHTSGYELITNTEKTLEIIDYYKRSGSKISFDLADPIVPNRLGNIVKKLLDDVDILFMTDAEACALTGNSALSSLDEVANVVPIVNLKLGSKGSIVKKNSKGNIERYDIPIYPVEVINKIGAGDSYAAGFLFGYRNNFALKECANFGSYIASRVCGMERQHF